MVRILKRRENKLIKYLGWNSSFCPFVKDGSLGVENCGGGGDERKLDIRCPVSSL